MSHPKRIGLVAATGCALAISASVFPLQQHAQAAPARTSGSVGFLFSDFTTSARWAFDRDFFKAALKKTDPNVNVMVQDAKNDQTQQQNEARSLLTSGVKVLIDVPVDSVQAKAVVTAAHASHVKVIAYDRLIEDAPVDAYATFNGFQVGKQQARYLVKHVKAGATIVSIAGASTDNNAHLFHAGAMSVLRPLFKSHHFKLGYDQYTAAWDVNKAQQEMSAALTKLNDKVGGVLVANDGMGAGVIAALKAQHLNGKIPVTGQDATIAGIQQILLGNQSMTVYKPIRELAAAAARITHLFLQGKQFHSTLMVPNGAGRVPSVYLPVVTVTRYNIKSTVIKDHYVTKAELCNGIPASACKGL